jgi:hypothetical protein
MVCSSGSSCFRFLGLTVLIFQPLLHSSAVPPPYDGVLQSAATQAAPPCCKSVLERPFGLLPFAAQKLFQDRLHSFDMGRMMGFQN